MTISLNLNKQADGLIALDGRPLDTKNWTLAEPVTGGEQISVDEAFDHLGELGQLRKIVVGIIGPRLATAEQVEAAEQIARDLAAKGITLICGGKSGVMEAASKGCSEAGGLMIGILPGSGPEEANAFVGVPLPTGLGEARNMIIAKAARVLVAIGGSYGTLSEVAYGLHFSKPVIGLAGAANVEGVIQVSDANAAVRAILEALLRAAVGAKSSEYPEGEEKP